MVDMVVSGNRVQILVGSDFRGVIGRGTLIGVC